MTISLRSAAWLIIIVAVAMGAGRIMSAQLLFEPSMRRAAEADPKVDRRSAWPAVKPRPMPTFSSNDRARWATVRAIVDDGTYVVGKRELLPNKPDDPKYKDTGIIFEDGWQSIDRVLHPEKLEFYSSKPPLLSSLVAGLYWLLKTLFGWTLDGSPFAVVRTILLLINVVPFLVALLVLDNWLARFAREGWTRLVILSAAAFATLATPFLITFNNHNLALYSVVFALDGLLKIWLARTTLNGSTSLGLGRHYLQAGFFAAFAATNELPALAFAVAVLMLLLYFSPTQTVLFAVPATLVVAFAFFGTNYLAVGQWRPAYSEFGSPWYEYEGSHWRKPPEGEIKYGIDWARFHETRGEYAFHALLGHHGLFSLTPLWILALAGMVVGLRPSKATAAKRAGAGMLSHTGHAAPLPYGNGSEMDLPRFLAPLTLGLTLVVLGFYLVRSDNYGGWSNGLRWLMWLSPLWLLTMVPIVDRLANTSKGRAFVYVLLAASVFSAHYTLWNPWRQPWIYDLMQACGWHAYGR